MWKKMLHALSSSPASCYRGAAAVCSPGLISCLYASVACIQTDKEGIHADFMSAAAPYGP